MTNHPNRNWRTRMHAACAEWLARWDWQGQPGARMLTDDQLRELMQTTYFRGDLARYTGKTQILHGGLFYEIEILEGHLKGQIKVTQRPPKEAA